MQRRVRHNSDDSLPMTEQDLMGPVPSSKSRATRIKHPSRSNNNNHVLIVCIASGIVLLSIFFLFQTSTTGSHSDGRFKPENPMKLHLPLHKFKSLQYSFENARLVGIYFAASWCSMSTPVTERIEEFLGTRLLPPALPGHHPSDDQALISLVYVSSDRNEEAFQQYLGTNWMAIPFDSTERTELKRYFKVCSKPEVESLGIERKFEIPTLLILDGETQTVITTSGVNDLEEYKENALDHWLDLQNLMRAMEEKFGEVEDSRYNNPRHPENRYHHHADSFSSLFT